MKVETISSKIQKGEEQACSNTPLAWLDFPETAALRCVISTGALFVITSISVRGARGVHCILEVAESMEVQWKGKKS